MKTVRTSLIVIWVTVTILILINIFIDNRSSDKGKRFNQLLEEAERLKVENTLLEMEIAKRTSLLNISEKAQEMGFTKPSKIEYIK